LAQDRGKGKALNALLLLNPEIIWKEDSCAPYPLECEQKDSEERRENDINEGSACSVRWGMVS
jgi:hypothetical protein